MMRPIVAIVFLTLACVACNPTKYGKQVKRIDFTGSSLQPIIKREPGIKVYDASFVQYNFIKRNKLNVFLDKPVVVAVADQSYVWGFFQFPNIGYKRDGTIGINWSMKRDMPEEYGKASNFSWLSKNGGKNWTYIDNDKEGFGGLQTPNGDYIKMRLPNNIPEKDLKLPPPTAYTAMAYNNKPSPLYKIDDLPESRQGVFFERLKKDGDEWVNEQDKLFDPTGYRYTYNGFMPVVWLGDMRLYNDTVYTCVYRDLRHGKGDTKEGRLRDGMGCFYSIDNGYSWHFQGASFYTGGDKSVDSIAEKRAGWLEPSMEVLKDGSFVCILRTDDGQGKAPLYLIRSYDKGKTWTDPKAITAYGVFPRLLLLDNGVLVLSSGRPGVSVRFSTDQGNTWTEAFEQLDVPYSDEWNYTCGYTNMIPTGKNKFLIVYSDFKMKNEKGEYRKGIKVREITVNK